MWNVQTAEALDVLAYAAAAMALFRLFRSPQAAWLGRLRWVLCGLVSVLAGLHLAAASAGGLGLAAPQPELALAASVCQLALGVGLVLAWRRFQRPRARAMGHGGLVRPAAAQELLDLAAPVAHFGHWRADLKTGELGWSDEMYPIHGQKKGHFAPEFDTALAMLHPEDRKTVAARIAMAAENSERFEIKARIRRPDSELRHIVLHGKTGNDGAVIGVTVDVTEQKAAEARLREANHVALQANAALKDMVMEDSLTGLCNRRQFDLSLVREFKRAIRSNLPLGLVLLDIDNFQDYNAQFGQVAGDICLRRIAQALNMLPRRTGDMVARFGSDEIALLLPLAGIEGAMRVAEMGLHAIRGLKIVHQGSDSGFVTVSCGVAAFTSVAELNNPLELVQRAGQAVELAKSGGCDRIMKYAPEMASDMLDIAGPVAQFTKTGG